MPENSTFHDVDCREFPSWFQYSSYLRKSSLKALEVVESVHGEYQVDALLLDLAHLLCLLLQEADVGESSLITSAPDHPDSIWVRFDREDESALPDELS